MIIGITGTLGAGKGAVVSYLVSKKGFTHFSARDLFAEKMHEAGIPLNRDAMIDFANALREEHGPRYVFDELYARAREVGTPAVIESIRTIGEAEALKEQGGILLAVDADRKIRFDRIHGRGSALDQVTFEEFQAQESREMYSEDLNKQNIAKVMEMADYMILNNGGITELYEQIEHILVKKLDKKI